MYLLASIVPPFFKEMAVEGIGFGIHRKRAAPAVRLKGRREVFIRLDGLRAGRPWIAGIELCDFHVSRQAQLLHQPNAIVIDVKLIPG